MSRGGRPEPSLWADLLDSGPELDEGDLNDLHTPPSLTSSSTSPSLTLGEAPVSDQLSFGELPLDEPTPDERARVEPSGEFDQFEALDELTSIERRSQGPHPSAHPSAHLAEPQEASGPDDDRVRLQPMPVMQLTEAQLKRAWLSRYSVTLSALIMCVLLALLTELLLTTPLLRLTEVTLTHPSAHLSAPYIERLFELDQRYINALSVDTNALKALLEKEPWVIRAEVQRRLPRGLEVTLTEHQTAGVAVFDTLYAINAQGEPIAPLSPVEAIGLPLISGVPHSLFFSEREHIGRALLTLGLEVSQLYQESGLEELRPLSEVYIAETGYVELILKQTRVSVGRANFTDHFKNLGHILRTLKRKQVDAQYILLSADFTRAIVKEVPAQVDEEVNP